MKTIKLLVALAFIFAGVQINAQRPITLGEDTLAFGKTNLPCLVVNIPEVNFERVQKNWLKTIQAGTKSKASNENGEISVFGAIKKEITPDPFNIYSELMNRDSLVSLMVAFETKKDEYIESAKGDELVTKAKTFLKNFAKDQYVDLVNDQLTDENKKLRELNNSLKSLQNEKSRLQKSIQSNKSTITAENDAIVIQNSEISKLTPEILEVTSQLSGMDESTAKDEKAKYLKELEKSKKKALNAIESSENKIDKANNEIDQANRDIPKNESEQSMVMSKITSQETAVQNVTDKLKIVKAY